MKIHVLFCGTKIFQHTYEYTNGEFFRRFPDNGVLCYVLQTSWVKWNIVKNDLVSPCCGRAPAMRIFQRYHFSSQLKRIIVVAGYTPPGSEPVMITAVKGIPEVLESMFSSIPEGYVEEYKSLAQKGYHVLLFGNSSLENLDNNNI
uniref:Probable cation-transporting ATPase (inferred by orthology to a C. elegans protein) n=1 Tax=Strongyloides venezuelensis TaxID=75913 RepID=A0A0K0FRG5_STRVS